MIFLSILAGAILPLAFAPLNLYPIAVVSPFLLLWILSRAAQAKSFWYGWFFGLGLFGVGASWIQVSIHRYGGVSLPVSIGLTTLFVMGLALFIALQSWLWVRFLRNKKGGVLFGFPLLWVLFEWIRGWILTGFPWLYLGYSQVDSPLAGFMPVIGVWGVSGLLVLTSSLIFNMRPWVSAVTSVSVLLVIWFSGFKLQAIDWVKPQEKSIRVSLVQGDVPQEQKWLPEEKIPILKKYLKLTGPYWDSDLIIWPENAVPMFLHQLESFTKTVAEQARQSGAALIIGVPIQEENSKRYFNGAAVLGNGFGLYLKHHLVPFGEYVPLQGWLRGLIDFFNLPMSDFSVGSAKQPLLRANHLNVGVTICYEIAYGRTVARRANQADLLLTLSDDAWFGHSWGPHQHLQIARARALETGRPILRATNNGITAVIDHRGKIIDRLPQFVSGVLTTHVTPTKGLPPYVRLVTFRQ